MLQPGKQIQCVTDHWRALGSVAINDPTDKLYQCVASYYSACFSGRVQKNEV